MIDYNLWYSDWSKSFAKNYTADELSRLCAITNKALHRASNAHLRSINKTTGMQSHSQGRAHSRNTVAMLGDKLLAINAALEIHKLFPEKAKL